MGWRNEAAGLVGLARTGCCCPSLGHLRVISGLSSSRGRIAAGRTDTSIMALRECLHCYYLLDILLLKSSDESITGSRLEFMASGNC